MLDRVELPQFCFRLQLGHGLGLPHLGQERFVSRTSKGNGCGGLGILMGEGGSPVRCGFACLLESAGFIFSVDILLFVLDLQLVGHLIVKVGLQRNSR